MKLLPIAAMALFAAAPAFASPTFLIDFEKSWDYSNGDVNGYYAGGTAADGSNGANQGVSFVNVSGLSNDAAFTYYANAPTPIGTAYAHDTALMNVIAGVDYGIAFFYSSPIAISGALKAYSGLDGTGTLLGSFDMEFTNGAFDINGLYEYDKWTQAVFTFTGTARSFDLTLSGVNGAAIDNIGTVPEPGTSALVLSALGAMGFLARRKKK